MTFIVSIHIPKTAGVSFREGLLRQLGERLLIDYEDGAPLGPPVRRRWRCLQAPTAETRRWADGLVERYDCVHGHFVATKYLRMLGDRARLCVFFRDPVERFVSDYRFSSSPGHESAPLVRSMTPEQFASLSWQRRMYELYMGEYPMERFDFVGITEEYETSLRLFKAIFGIDIPSYRLNEAPSDGIDAGEYRGSGALQATQRQNQAVHDAARRRFDALCRQWAVDR